MNKFSLRPYLKIMQVKQKKEKRLSLSGSPPARSACVQTVYGFNS